MRMEKEIEKKCHEIEKQKNNSQGRMEMDLMNGNENMATFRLFN